MKASVIPACPMEWINGPGSIPLGECPIIRDLRVEGRSLDRVVLFNTGQRIDSSACYLSLIIRSSWLGESSQSHL